MSATIIDPIGKNLLALDYAKRNLNIESDLHDSKIQELLFDAAQELNEMLRPYAAEVPILTGTPVYVQAQKAAMYHVRWQWFEHLSQLAKAAYNMEIFEKKMASLIKSIIAEKPDRRKVTFIPAKDPRDTIFQPFNKDEYIAKVF